MGYATKPQLITNCNMGTAVGGMNGNISSGSWANGRYSLKAMYHNTPTQYAQRYDEEFDDGKANSGSVSCYNYGGDSNGVLASVCTGTAAWPSAGTSVAVFVDL